MWHHQPMNFITSLALLSGLVVAIGAVVTAFALKNAPEGHEDETGFHFGREQLKPVAVEADHSEAVWTDSAARHEEHAVLA